MTSGFKTQINGKPTYFVEKIWKSLYIENHLVTTRLSYHSFKWKYFKKFGKCWEESPTGYKPKLHTLISDPHNRWKVGNKIHFVINKGTPQQFQFAPVAECLGLQPVSIIYNDGDPGVFFGDSHESEMPFYFKDWDEKTKDFVTYGENQMLKMANNDGFDSIDDFFAYFNQDFRGKIIHWTNLKY